MAYNHTIEPSVRLDLNEAIEYYLEINFELADALANEFYDGIEAIVDNPYLYQTISRSYRKLTLKRFPYKIIFNVKRELITIVALSHHKRKPNYWRKRT